MARIEKADFMSCVRIGNVIMCGSKVYKYKGYFFEWHSFCGPSPLRKDGELSKKIPKGFWDMIDEFCKMTDFEKEPYRV